MPPMNPDEPTLPSPPPDASTRVFDRPWNSALDEKVPKQIGAFKIIRLLGQGGMGAVYEAQQEQPRRPVALKVIRGDRYLDEHHVRLFQREAQALARLKHPCIGAIYESGRTEDGQHYFSMELVRGRPLPQFLSDTQPTIRRRLELFQRICEAVHYAHQQGVMHRDLKPGNILIDSDGNPKILDFGLARITDADVAATTLVTDIGQIAGTLQYMSPEQARGNPDEIDIRSDVYSLGVILYEMLTGALPYELSRAMMHESVRVICEEPPRRPSMIAKVLRGDIETIICKALEKEKSRRYEAASALAADIERYLSDQPIAARPPSAMYQLSKFARRNRGLVGGAAAVFTVLIVGVAVSTAMYLRAEKNAAEAHRQTERADHQRASAVWAAEFMSLMLEGVEASVALGRDTTMLREMLDSVAKKIEDGHLKDSPEAELRLRWAISGAYRDIAEGGANERAEKIILPTLELAERAYGAESEEMAKSLEDLAICLADLGRSGEALPKLVAAMEIRQRILKGDDQSVAMSLNNVANCLQRLGRTSEALPKHEAALEMRRRLFKGDHPDVASSLSNVASCLGSLGRSSEALPKEEAALEMLQRLFTGDHPDLAEGLNSVASCLHSLGRWSDAVPKYQAALEMRQRLFKGDHPDVAGSLNNLASSLHSLGRWSEALPKYEAALDMFRKCLPAGHPDLIYPQIGLANTLVKLKRFKEAEPFLIDTAGQCEKSFPANHVVRRKLLNVAVMLYDDWHAAEPGKGYHKKAAEWRAKLAEWQATTQPAASPPSTTQSANAQPSTTQFAASQPATASPHDAPSPKE